MHMLISSLNYLNSQLSKHFCLVQASSGNWGCTIVPKDYSGALQRCYGKLVLRLQVCGVLFYNFTSTTSLKHVRLAHRIVWSNSYITFIPFTNSWCVNYVTNSWCVLMSPYPTWSDMVTSSRLTVTHKREVDQNPVYGIHSFQTTFVITRHH